MKLLNKYIVKIPKNIKIIYTAKKDILTFIGPASKKSLKLNSKIFINEREKLLYVKNCINFMHFSNKSRLSLRGSLVALLKQHVLESSFSSYKKLRLVGVGYKVFIKKNDLNSVLEFKVGFSHSIFFKLTTEVKILCLKFLNCYIFGNCLKHLAQLTAVIRLAKLPEPYKGKGILYKNEKIKLKIGKKV